MNINNQTIKDILLKIKYNNFNLEDLKNYNLKAKHKIILTLAYYDKNNYPKSLIKKYLKEQKNIYKDSKLLLEIINYLENQLKNQKRKFNLNIYFQANNIGLKNEELIINNITTLISEKKYLEALKLCNNNEYKNNQIIISLKVKILFALNYTKEAFRICKTKEHQNSSAIQVEYLKHLYYLKDYDQALLIIDNPKFINNPSIMWYYAKILIKLNCYIEAYNICQNPKFQNDKKFTNLKLKLIPYLKTYYQEKLIFLLKLKLKDSYYVSKTPLKL